MKSLKIEPTKFTPKIVFDPSNNVFHISGFSLPEDVSGFYTPVLKWLDEYIKNPNQLTEFKFRFDYFNTSSLKYFLMILSKCKDLKEADAEIKIKWYYDHEDESMLEAGKSLEELSELKFDFIENE